MPRRSNEKNKFENLFKYSTTFKAQNFIISTSPGEKQLFSTSFIFLRNLDSHQSFMRKSRKCYISTETTLLVRSLYGSRVGAGRFVVLIFFEIRAPTATEQDFREFPCLDFKRLDAIF